MRVRKAPSWTRNTKETRVVFQKMEVNRFQLGKVYKAIKAPSSHRLSQTYLLSKPSSKSNVVGCNRYQPKHPERYNCKTPVIHPKLNWGTVQ